MPWEFTVTERIHFSDTDMAGIVHFSNFFRLMERAEHAFFRSLGTSIFPQGRILETMDESERVGWPRVDASCQYFQPLYFEDEVTIRLFVSEVRTRSISYVFRFLAQNGELAALGKMTIVCVRKDEETGRMKAVEIPPTLRTWLEVAPAEELAKAMARAN